ncbi:hypothetical protein C0585_05475 [Candidatus Woesearchaeota archaeon]|nr:MAG: hypothetical protein C0585_05475 [Candidatus Woesearchaeota archaeon]
MASTFRGIIEFFDKLGIYDVILPFLLVFTIVFAILEKSKILGMEKIGEDTVTRKNLNSMVSFVIAFLVVASSELVRTINEAMANMVLLLMLSISFMLLVGSFHKGDEEFFLKDGYRTLFMVIIFIALVGIFLHAIHYKGEPFLTYAWDWLVDRWDTNAMGSVILILITVGFMWWLTKDDQKIKNTKSEE